MGLRLTDFLDKMWIETGTNFGQDRMDTLRDIEQNMDHVWCQSWCQVCFDIRTLHVLTLYFHFVPKSAFSKIW